MSGTVIGIKNNKSSNQEIVINCDNLSLGIRNKNSNIRYVKKVTPIDWDVEECISESTSKVFNIFSEVIHEFEGKSTKIAVILPVIFNRMTTICSADGINQMRKGFTTLIETATAITEPILWFYALAACILMATGKKGVGWDKLKNVGYSYILITMLPTLFEFCRWVSRILMTCIKMS